MSEHHPHTAKIMQHAEGVGAPDTQQVRRRARELATIDGRGDFNEQDWREAQRELLGGHERTSSDDEAEMSVLVSGHDMIAANLGHHVENVGMEDSQNVLEELIAEGMDEAVHEQMLAARGEEDDGEEDEE